MHRPSINPKVSVSVVFVAAMFMSIMDGTIVNVALPSLSRQFNAPGTSIDAVVVGYLVSLAIVIPASGWLGDRLGTKRIFLCALAVFTGASALCGLATSLPMLIGFRLLQGMGGGAMTPVGMAILYRAFPPRERIQVSRILNIPTVFAPASGPVIGGLLIVKLSWRWVFYVNVPIGILAFVFGLLFLQEYRRETAGDFDLAGFLLGGFGLALSMYALSEGPSYGWTSPAILATGIVGLALLITFVLVELRSTHPILNLRLLSNRSFRTGNLISFFSAAGFLSLLYAGPLFLQEARVSAQKCSMSIGAGVGSSQIQSSGFGGRPETSALRAEAGNWLIAPIARMTRIHKPGPPVRRRTHKIESIALGPINRAEITITTPQIVLSGFFGIETQYQAFSGDSM
jgi:EmrB/QacA subfamily drug resistance transporter